MPDDTPPTVGRLLSACGFTEIITGGGKVVSVKKPPSDHMAALVAGSPAPSPSFPPSRRIGSDFYTYTDVVAEMWIDMPRGTDAFPILNMTITDPGTREFHRLGALQGRMGNPNRVPSKKDGRKGTRRAWKRAHPPGWLYKTFIGEIAADLGISYQEITRPWDSAVLGRSWGGPGVGWIDPVREEGDDGEG